MKLITILFLLTAGTLFAQVKYEITVRDSLSKDPLYGATISIKNSTAGAITGNDGKGVVKLNYGLNTINITYVGYKTKAVDINADKNVSSGSITVFLTPSGVELQQVTVTTSRVSSYINDSPQRIETLGLEELQEKTFENPANISELLSELSAVQVVQTSTFSGTTNFRLLGLSGQYTQILKDGFPVFGGLSQDFGLVQIPPLDLAQIEIIKGASSSFYGNGAVAGIINLISKVPQEKPEGNILLNATGYGGIDAGGFYSSKKGAVAFTILAMADSKPAKDVNGDGFTEISKLRKYNIEPKLFLEFDDRNSLKIGTSYLHDEHTGGDIEAVNNKPSSNHPYSIEFLSDRFIATADYRHTFGNNNSLNVKEGISLFNLSTSAPGFYFKGKQFTSYSEINYTGNTGDNSFTIGGSLLADNFSRNSASSIYFDDYNQFQAGIFAVDNLKLGDSFNLQGALRFEKPNNFDSYLLPNLSLIYKPAENFFLRLGYGTGCRIPSPISFLSEMELNQTDIASVSAPLKTEYSNSFSLDANYNLVTEDNFYFRINQTFFLAGVKNPYLETEDAASGKITLITQSQPLRSYGAETNLTVGMEDASLFVGFTYQKTEREYAGNSALPLTPELKIVSILQIEEEGLWELDLGNIFMGNQYLADGEKIKPYTTFEALLKIKAGLFNVVLNCENIFNFMQSDIKPLVIPPYTTPRFNEIWGPVEGRTLNVSVIYSF